MKKKSWIRLFLLLCLFAPVSQLLANELHVGDTLPSFMLKNQHGESVAIAANAQIILFTVEKSASELVNNYLEKQPADLLAVKRAYFVVDISGMPWLITQMFALPKMRKLPYSILLAEDALTVSFIPRQQNRVTVIRLKQGRVESIQFISTEIAIDALF
jgi:hypothetical protein